MSRPMWISLIVCLAIPLGAIMSYNNLVGLNETVNASWSQIDNQLQRRGDLIPNLAATVKGYAAHEQSAIQAVSDARARLAGARGPAAKGEADATLTSALSRLLAIAENYPNLKADANFRGLSDELSGTENRIATARRDYNESVRRYETKIKVFPNMLYATALGFGPKEYFKAGEGAKDAPQVKF